MARINALQSSCVANRRGCRKDGGADALDGRTYGSFRCCFISLLDSIFALVSGLYMFLVPFGFSFSLTIVASLYFCVLFERPDQQLPTLHLFRVRVTSPALLDIIQPSCTLYPTSNQPTASQLAYLPPPPSSSHPIPRPPPPLNNHTLLRPHRSSPTPLQTFPQRGLKHLFDAASSLGAALLVHRPDVLGDGHPALR